MRFNPVKRILYTDKGEVIRKLDCPYRVSLPENSCEPHSEHICDICNGEIIDTNAFDDDVLLQLGKNLSLCFKVDATQPNLRLVYF